MPGPKAVRKRFGGGAKIARIGFVPGADRKLRLGERVTPSRAAGMEVLERLNSLGKWIINRPTAIFARLAWSQSRVEGAEDRGAR